VLKADCQIIVPLYLSVFEGRDVNLDLVRMEAFRMDQPRIYQYTNQPENYYNENPAWKWREDLREVSSPELGKKAAEAIANHLVELIRKALEEGE
jgi:hypothetical protein